MIRALALFLTLVLCSLAGWAAANPVVGKWDCISTDETGRAMSWTLVVREAEGKLSGSLLGTQGEDIPLVDPKLDGDTFSFKIVINPQETVEVQVKIDGKKLEGKFKGRDSGTGSLKGTKQA